VGSESRYSSVRSSCEPLRWGGYSPGVKTDMTSHDEDTTIDRERRAAMVREQLKARGISAAGVLQAMARVPRHRFVPERYRGDAYADKPLPLGPDQTISQPYIVAFMLEVSHCRRGHRVLEVGTGSGYQTALLAELGAEVYSIEIDPELSATAADRLRRLGLTAHFKVGDGAAGWAERGPFDVILVGAASPSVPRELVAQLAPGGRLVLPVGEGRQELVLFEQGPGGLTSRHLCGVKFVPLKTPA